MIIAAVPDRPEAEQRFGTRYLDERFMDQPSLAIGQASREAARMADLVQAMLRDAAIVIRSGSQELLEEVVRRDDQVDYLEREVKLYLTRLDRQIMTEDLARREIAPLSDSSAISRTSATSSTRTSWSSRARSSTRAAASPSPARPS